MKKEVLNTKAIFDQAQRAAIKLFATATLTTLAFTGTSFAQGVGINSTGAAPHSSAGLDLDFNNKGFLPPRMTTEHRDAILNPATGLILYNTTLSTLQINDGTPISPIWNSLSSSSGNSAGLLTSINCVVETNTGILIQGYASSGVNSIFSYTSDNLSLHSGQVVHSTGVTGLTATLLPGVFANGSGKLTYTITGTPSAGGTANFEINIGGQNCTLTRTVLSSHANICNLNNPTAIVDVLNITTNKTWMDRNLGSNRAATYSMDAESYGSLFQWGRGADGHQCVHRFFPGDLVTTSGTTATTSTTDTPPNGNFILRSATPFDWRTTQNNNLWQGVNGINNPCPSGYRLPSEAELTEERNSWSSSNSSGAFGSPLKLPMAGFRGSSNGALGEVGVRGYYWTSTINTTNARQLNFNEVQALISNSGRANGISVRCIKN